MGSCEEPPPRMIHFAETSNFHDCKKKAEKSFAVTLCGGQGSGRKSICRRIIKDKWHRGNSRWHELEITKRRKTRSMVKNLLADYGITNGLDDNGDLDSPTLIRKMLHLLNDKCDAINKFIIVDLSSLSLTDVQAILSVIDEFCDELSKEAKARSLQSEEAGAQGELSEGTNAHGEQPEDTEASGKLPVEAEVSRVVKEAGSFGELQEDAEACGKLSEGAKARWTILVPVTYERWGNYESNHPHLVCHKMKELEVADIEKFIRKHLPEHSSADDLAKDIKESSMLPKHAQPLFLGVVVAHLDTKSKDETVKDFIRRIFAIPSEKFWEEEKADDKAYLHNLIKSVLESTIMRIIDKRASFKERHKKIIQMISLVDGSIIHRDLPRALALTHKDWDENTAKACVDNLLVELNQIGLIQEFSPEQGHQDGNYYSMPDAVHQAMAIMRKELTLTEQVDLVIDTAIVLLRVMPKKGRVVNLHRNSRYIAHGKALLDNVDRLLNENDRKSLDHEQKLALRLLRSHLGYRLAFAMVLRGDESNFVKYVTSAFESYNEAVSQGSNYMPQKKVTPKFAISVYRKSQLMPHLQSTRFRTIAQEICRYHIFTKKSLRGLPSVEDHFVNDMLTPAGFGKRLTRGEVLHKIDHIKEEKVVDGKLLSKVFVGEWLTEIFSVWSLGRHFPDTNNKAAYVEKAQIAYDLCVEIYKDHGVHLLSAVTAYQTVLLDKISRASDIREAVSLRQRCKDWLLPVPSGPGSVPTSGATSLHPTPAQPGPAAASFTPAALAPTQNHPQMQGAIGFASTNGMPSIPSSVAQPGPSIAAAAPNSFNSLPQDSVQQQDASAPITSSRDHGSPYLDSAGLLSSPSPMAAIGVASPGLSQFGEVATAQSPPAPAATPAVPPLPPRSRQTNPSQPPTQPVAVQQPSGGNPINRKVEVYERGHLLFVLEEDDRYDVDFHHELRSKKMELQVLGVCCRLDPTNPEYLEEGGALIKEIRKSIKSEKGESHSEKEYHAAMCKAYKTFAQFYGELDDHLVKAMRKVIVALDHLSKSSLDKQLDPNSFQFQCLTNDLRLYLDRYKGKHGSRTFLTAHDKELRLLEEMMSKMKPLRGHMAAGEGPHLDLFCSIRDDFTLRELVHSPTDD